MKSVVLETQKLCINPFLHKLSLFANGCGVQLYMVGGCVRDLLLDRPTIDFDFTLASDAIQFAKSFAKFINGTFIALEEEPPTARVIVKTGNLGKDHLSIDFAQFRAASLIDDLCLRDLTINAMAIPLDSFIESRQPELIDPCDGKKDLVNATLRFLSEQVILDDPLRLLRVFRFAAQLEFDITEKSLLYVQKHQHQLPNVSRERIREEFLKILNVDTSIAYLQKMHGIGLLAHVLPPIVDLGRSWKSLEKFENNPIPHELYSYTDEIDVYLHTELESGANRRSLIKLSLLRDENLSDVGNLLRLSRKSVKYMATLVTGEQLIRGTEITHKEIIHLLRDTVGELWGVLLFSEAKHPILPEIHRKIVDTHNGHFLPILKQGRLISGGDLIEEFNLKEGKEIGDILKQIEDRQFYGEIRTRKEAFTAAEELIQKK